MFCLFGLCTVDIVYTNITVTEPSQIEHYHTNLAGNFSMKHEQMEHYYKIINKLYCVIFIYIYPF